MREAVFLCPGKGRYEAGSGLKIRITVPKFSGVLTEKGFFYGENVDNYVDNYFF